MSYSIGFDIFAKDRASDTFDKLGKKVGDTDKKFSKSTAAIGVGVAAAGVAVVAFAKDSIAAFGEAEKSQRVLTDAYGRFPAMADVSIGSLRDLATAQQTKTKFDGDEVAALMGTLGQYKLNGKQIKELTPLILDYAEKTGKDLPTAGKLMGLAVMGNAKALKEVGINIPKTADATKTLTKAQDKAAASADRVKDAQRKLSDLQAIQRGKSKLTVQDSIAMRNAQEDLKDATGDHADALEFVGQAQKGASKTGGKFTEIVAGLRKQVGGFAEKEGLSAEGRAAILKNKFGDLQETVGSKLQPKLEQLTDAGIKVVDWMSKNEGTVKTLGTAIGVLVVGIGAIVAITKVYTAVQTALNVVMAMNPIGLVIVAIALLAAGMVIAYQKSETFRKVVDQTFRGIQIIVGNVVSVCITIVRSLLTAWTTVIGGILSAAASVAEQLGLPFAKGLRDASNSFNKMATDADNKLKGIADSASKWGDVTGKNYAAGIKGTEPAAKAAAAYVAKGTKYALNFNAAITGQTVATNFGKGISGQRAELVRIAAAVAKSVRYALVLPPLAVTPPKAAAGAPRFALRARGGPTLAGHTYMVGEEGPELRTEMSDGFITNAADTARLLAGRGGSSAAIGGGGEIHNHFHIAGQVYGSTTDLANVVLTGLQRLQGSGKKLGLT